MVEVLSRYIESTQAQVDILRVGDTSVYRLADLDNIVWPAQALFRSLTPELLRLHARRSPAGSVEPETGNLRLSFNLYLVHTPDEVILIDAGAGNDKERPDRPAWHRLKGRLLETMAILGFKPEAIDVVVNTHLHADHVGWNTVKRPSGWVPAFPRARYVAPRKEFEHWSGVYAATGPEALHGAFVDSILPLQAAGVLELVSPDHRIVEGLAFEPAPGHSPGMCIVRLDRGGETVLFTADIMHHPLQLADRALTSNFCADPEMARQTRGRFLARYAGTGAVLAPYHFPPPSFGLIEPAGEEFSFVPLRPVIE